MKEDIGMVILLKTASKKKKKKKKSNSFNSYSRLLHSSTNLLS